MREVTPFLCVILVNDSNNPLDKAVVTAFATVPSYSVPLHSSPADPISAWFACAKVIYSHMLSSQSHEPINLTVVHIAKCIRSTWLFYWIEVLNSTVTEESVVICTLFKFRTSLHKKLLIRALNLCVGTGAKIV